MWTFTQFINTIGKISFWLCYSLVDAGLRCALNTSDYYLSNNFTMYILCKWHLTHITVYFSVHKYNFYHNVRAYWGNLKCLSGYKIYSEITVYLYRWSACRLEAISASHLSPFSSNFSLLYSSSSLVSVEYSKLGPWIIKEMACITLIEQYKKKISYKNTRMQDENSCWLTHRYSSPL